MEMLLKKSKIKIRLFSAVLLLTLCCSPKPESMRPPVLTQISTIDALLAGCYDGVMPIRKLHRYGDFGIGTFEKLDGEMVVLDDTLYQILLDGEARTESLPDSTPFFTVTRFRPDTNLTVNRISSLDSLRKFITQCLPDPNLFCAVKISGQFAKLKTRSVPPQKKPYLPLNEVVSLQQKIVDSENRSGSVVGFYMPAFVKGINVPGFHLHFISGDRKMGGHLFECALDRGTVELQICRQFSLILPDRRGDFGAVNFSKDRSGDLENVVKAPKIGK